MSRLDDLLTSLCPDGVKQYRIDSLCTITRGRVMSKDYIAENTGNYPVYSSQTENNGELGCISTYDYDGEYLTWTTDGANAGTVFYRSGKFSVTNVCGLLKVNRKDLLTRFLYYTLSVKAPSYVNSGMGNPKLMSNVMARITVPVPPLEVQLEIVRILDSFTTLTADLQADLQAELQASKKQYEHYKNVLLKGKGTEEIVSVMDICNDIFLGLTAKVDYVKEGGIPLARANNMTTGILNLDNARCISVEQHDKLTKIHKPQRGDILISKSGTLGAVCIVDTDVEFSIYESLICLQPNKRVYGPYLLHLLRSKDIQDIMLQKKVGNAVKHLNLLTFRKLYIPLPSFEKQTVIAKILDKLDLLYKGISVEIPAEINARQKQYEYYRDHLLAFKEKTA